MVNFEAGDSSLKEQQNTSELNDSGVNGDESSTGGKTLHPQPWCGQHVNTSDSSNKNVYKYGSQEDKEKTPMCRIAELARYHKLKHEYKLMDESGPAHKKLFSVQLVLTNDQIFDGSGASIKKAQQAAAANALERTTLSMPPDKSGRKKKDASSPIQLLSHVCRRLNLPEPQYRPHPPQKVPRTRIQLHMPPIPPPHLPPHMMPVPGPRGPSDGPMMNGPPNGVSNGYGAPNFPPLNANQSTSPPIMPPQPGLMPVAPPFVPIPPRMAPPFAALNQGSDRGMCVVSVVLSPYKMFTACAPTFIQAKMEAAVQALNFMGPAIQHLDAEIREKELKKKKSTEELVSALARMKTTEKEEKQPEPVCPAPNGVNNNEKEGEGEIPKHRQKSVISQVHECALQMKLNVEFEVLMEDGPPHERTYSVKCALTDGKGEAIVEGTGDGRKKKEATQNACCNVLAKLRGIENSPLFLASNLLKAQKKVQCKEPKRKTIVKDMKMDPSYGHQINPVSRLIQVLQARNEPDPQFSLIGEHGQSRYKEFVVQVVCGDQSCTGNGPNKRLAKRAAAEAMLAQIGYVKPLPAPGKSLLKRKEPQMTIGVFDPNNLEPPSAAEPADETTVALVQPNAEEQKSEQTAVKWDTPDVVSPCRSEPNSGHVSPSDSNHVPQSPGARRRVTFNSQVEACPPPEDANYPQAEVAPLKADVVVEGRLKRMKKSKDGKRSLTADQKLELTAAAQSFVHQFCASRVGVDAFAGTAAIAPELDSELQSSKTMLATFSEKYKFSVQYTNFPKSPDGSDQLYFALVSLGLEKPLVCHGSGSTVENAADNAAYNAICNLAKLVETTTGSTTGSLTGSATGSGTGSSVTATGAATVQNTAAQLSPSQNP